VTPGLSTSGGNRVLARTPAGALECDDRSLDEKLPTPDAPWLLAAQCAGKALGPNRACPTQGLGKLDVGRTLLEPQLGVGLPTRDVRIGVFAAPVQVDERAGELHLVSPLGVFIPRPGGVFKIWGVDVGTTQKPRIPDVGFRGLEVT
jgi:hypothetical protein